MDVLEALTSLGGVATARQLVRLSSARQLRAAVAAGVVVRVGRGRFRTKDADKALKRAAELRGMASHLSAAQVHGWEMPYAPSIPWITVPRQRQVPKERRAIVVWADLSDEGGFVTGKLRTVVDCGRRCEFVVALSVADSAIRCGDVDAEAFAKAAGQVRGKGAARVRRVAEHASGLAANAFESALRGIALEAGLDARPQVPVTTGGIEIHPDVVDVDRRIVLEADSWEFHATKDAFQRDCWRYTSLTADGWTVLRFTWWQVMEQPDWVREVIERVVARTAVGANAA
jgi:very-short-patch-repair endonuclease